MRRTKLIWFALGAATSAIFAAVVLVMTPQPASKTLVLRIEEPDDLTTAQWSRMSKAEAQIMQFRAADVARQCGAEGFRVITPFDGGPMTEVTIAENGGEALNCILREAARKRMPMTIQRTAAL